MSALSTRTRLLLAVLVAAVVGGVAAGVVLARGDGNGAAGRPGVLAHGSFKSVTWGASGTATIVRDRSGRLKLRLSRSFQTKQAPELYVYLVSTRGGHTQRREVGVLKRASGGQEYNLPADASRLLPASVEILCAKCNSTFAAARVQPARGL